MGSQPDPRRTAAAREELLMWAHFYAQRDRIVKKAHAAGLGFNEIAEITGLPKVTMLRILRPEG